MVTAEEVLGILEKGRYVAEDGCEHAIGDAVAAAVTGTRLYTPDALAEMLAERKSGACVAMRIEVTGETTQAAAHRLVRGGVRDLALLNFASARNPGGGFIRGAKAQEEDLARASALYLCLVSQPAYYAANRAQDSLLYTDHLIYSPRVPFFRADEALVAPFLATVVTAPAPNRGEVLRRDPSADAGVERAFRRRAGYVLAVCAAHGHRNLLLGAWGCGVFRNDPVLAADAFGAWLESDAFAGAFDSVVFAVYGRASEDANVRAFRARFEPRS